MHLAKTAQILFFLANHLAAAHTHPGTIFPSYQAHKAPDADLLGVLKPRFSETYNASLGLVQRQESCDRRAKCKRKKIRDPTDDTKCIRCPPLTKADPTKTICIKDNDISQDDKKKQYQEKIKEKIKEKFEKFKENIKERVNKKKEKKQLEWDEKDKRRQDARNQKKYRRMAACAPLVAASIGSIAMLELANGGFSEDLFDSIDGDMLEFWPNEDDNWIDQAVPDDESDITNEDYVGEFLEVGDEHSKNFPNKRDDNHGTTPATSEATVSSPKKRGIGNAIGNAVRAIIRVIIAAATRRAGSRGPAARVTHYFSNGRTPNLKKPGESKLSRAQQKDKARNISKDPNWKRCLRGEKPEK